MIFVLVLLAAALCAPVHAVSDEEIRRALAAQGLPSQGAVIKDGQGRVQVDAEAHFSYAIFTPDPKDPASPTYFFPLSNVRGPNFNPPVFTVKPSGIETEPVKDFLLRAYREPGGDIVLYRGAERGDERAQWEAGDIAKGSIYYTPSATYAWRYARKAPGNFSTLLQQGEAPLFRFEVPGPEFERRVRSGDFTLGLELPRSAHQQFENSGVFRDVLTGGFYYLGDPRWGVELEIHSTRPGRWLLRDHYQGSITAAELGDYTLEQLQAASQRLVRQYPNATDTQDLVRTHTGNGSSRYSLPSDLAVCANHAARLRRRPQ